MVDRGRDGRGSAGLFASGQGHHAALGERVHVELEEMLEES
jgi:hypothetical protein